MSSLAAAQADGYYHPPDYDPRKHGGLNKYNGSHALGKRAKKVDQGILVVRFELPYKVWCGKCGFLLATGVRFNAEKQQAGSYYTTKIWRFTMKTACCGNTLVIRTDPAACEYVLESGGRRKVEEYDAEAAGSVTIVTRDEEDLRREEEDAFYRVERKTTQLRNAASEARALDELQRVGTARSRDAYMLNRSLRRELRAQRKEGKAGEEHARALNLHKVPLLPPSEEDARAASGVLFCDSAYDAEDRAIAARAEARAKRMRAAGPAGEARARKAAAAELLEAKRRRIERAGGRLIHRGG